MDEYGEDRFCKDHARGIRHEPHEWVEHLGERKQRKVRHHCGGSTLGRYASREDWRAHRDDVAASEPKSPRRQ